MDPSPVYYAVVGGAGTLVGVVADLVGILPWWVGTLAGLAGAWAFTWLTALDDVRHPVRSVRLVRAELGWPFSRPELTRARLLDLPLWVPPEERGGELWISSSGKEHRGGLLTPPRYRLALRWEGDGRSLAMATAAADGGETTTRGLPDGIAMGLVGLLSDEEHPDRVALAERVRPASLTVDGVERPARLLELGVERADWILQVDDVEGQRLVVTGDGLRPEDVELVRVGVDDLLERWPAIERP